MYHIACQQCAKWAVSPDAADPQGTLGDCGCCTEPHSHFVAACPGDHVHGPGVPGCLVCRPVIVTALPGAAVLAAMAGGA